MTFRCLSDKTEVFCLAWCVSLVQTTHICMCIWIHVHSYISVAGDDLNGVMCYSFVIEVSSVHVKTSHLVERTVGSENDLTTLSH